MPYLADKRIPFVCQIWHTPGGTLFTQRVHRSKKFKEWFKSLSEKDQGIVSTRIDTYLELGKLIKSKSLDSQYDLYEFKWDSGLRVYYAFLQDAQGRLMLLLLGGNKNSQASDITEAKNILVKAVTRIVERKRIKNEKS